MERQAEAVFTRIREMGTDGSITSGLLRGIEDGWFMAEIAESAFRYQQQLEKGDKRVVGVNAHTSTIEEPLEILRIGHQVEHDQRQALDERRRTRDDAAARGALDRMMALADTGDNLLPAMLDAVRAEATLGEICGALRDRWGAYAEPPRF
jgi:methylmalonyl-CoA mutase, N-terminal domain